MSERNKLEFISSVEIMNTPMKKQHFIVDEIIYPGLHILSGDPKIGKSWMMMDMCLSIAKGEKFLGRKTETGHVVYMALEDTFSSLQSRMYELTDEPTDNLQYVLLGNSIGNGLEDDLRECKKVFSDLKLIVIDTLQKVRGTVDMKYGTDYKELSVLKSIADELDIAIILVHHNRKAHDSNPNNMISGSTGLRGCADGAFVLIEKDKATHDATLYCEGRDIESRELKLQRTAHRWNLIADSCVSPEQFDDEIITAMVIVMKEVKSFLGTPTELTDKINQHTKKKYIPNVVSRKILQSAQRLLEQDVLFEMKRSNGIRKIQAQYFGDGRDDSDDKTDVSSSSAVDPVRNVETA